ncbi:MAG TPA: formate dehydrogenase subunit gamma [Steroidobacteraceae bacterium]|jgi:formate dehydrogenase subunit gamma|nr:formate dehydrogenase subunit gamma [Steroidobacteraceae bacterium]
MQTLTDEQRRAVLRIVAEHKSRPGPLIEILHGVQASLGFVPSGAVPVIAEGLNLSRAEVHGVVSFYHFFRTHPVGRHVVRVCQAESCQSMGAQALTAHAKRRLGIDFHETSADGAFTLEPVYCLGNCACSPALMIDDDLFGRVTAQQFDAMVTARQQPT